MHWSIQLLWKLILEILERIEKILNVFLHYLKMWIQLTLELQWIKFSFLQIFFFFLLFLLLLLFRARDSVRGKQEVAIKIIRNNEIMHKSGLKVCNPCQLIDWLIWFDFIWFDLIWFHLIWFHLIWSHLISFDLIWPENVKDLFYRNI